MLYSFFSEIQAGIALGDLSSLSDLYDKQSIALLFLIGVVSVTPTLLGKNEKQQGKGPEMVASSSWSLARELLLTSPSVYIWRSCIWLLPWPLFGSVQLMAGQRATEHGKGPSFFLHLWNPMCMVLRKGHLTVTTLWFWGTRWATRAKMTHLFCLTSCLDRRNSWSYHHCICTANQIQFFMEPCLSDLWICPWNGLFGRGSEQPNCMSFSLVCAMPRS